MLLAPTSALGTGEQQSPTRNLFRLLPSESVLRTLPSSLALPLDEPLPNRSRPPTPTIRCG